MTSATARLLCHLAVGALLAAVVSNEVTSPPTFDSWSLTDQVGGNPIAAGRVDLAERSQRMETASFRYLADDASGGTALVHSVRTQRSPGQSRVLHYVVAAGDSLASIADQFGIDVPTMLGANEIEDPDLLSVGTELRVPPIRGLLYRVLADDTVGQVAQRFGLDTTRIVEVNQLDSSDLIFEGEELLLPGVQPRPASSDQSLAATLLSVPILASGPSFIWPTDGRITTYFRQVGWTSPLGHAGIDIAAPTGRPIAAAAAGRVVQATTAGGPYGTMAIVDHGGGLRSVYAHLSQLNVDAGERVSQGQTLGLCGSTGFSTGPHLHFEIRQNGELRNPLTYLP